MARSFLNLGGLFGSRREAAASSTIRPQQTIFDRNQNILIKDNEKSISYLQEQIQSLQLQIVSINAGLNQISNLIVRDGNQDRAQLLEDQERQRRLNQSKLREGQENQLEQKIRSAIAAPLETVQKNMKGLFSRISRAIGYLFMGWLTDAAFSFIDEASQRNMTLGDLLKEKIKDNLDSILNITRLTFNGFGRIATRLLRAPLSVAGLGVRVFTSPFRLASKIFRPVLRPLSKVPLLSKLFRGAGKVPNVIANITKKIIPGINLGLGSAEIYERLKNKDIFGAAVTGASLLPGFGLPFIGLNLMRDFGLIDTTYFDETFSKLAEKINIPEVSKDIKIPNLGEYFKNFDVKKTFIDIPELSSLEPEVSVIKSSSNQVAPQEEKLVVNEIPIYPSSNSDNYHTVMTQRLFNLLAT